MGFVEGLTPSSKPIGAMHELTARLLDMLAGNEPVQLASLPQQQK
jgi:hypothetical protein